MIKKYQKRPVVIEALQYTGENIDEVMAFLGHEFAINEDDGLFISTLEGVMKASSGDFIIKGVDGEFYPCKEHIFKKTYVRAYESEGEQYGNSKG